jgi:hypothetical protein
VPAGSGRDDSAEIDEWSALIEQNLDKDSVASGRSVPLEVALMHCEARLGAAWVSAPARWGAGPRGTLDGCVPVRVVWARFLSLDMHRAVDVMDTTRGIGLAFGGESSAASARETVEAAFPEDVSDG